MAALRCAVVMCRLPGGKHFTDGYFYLSLSTESGMLHPLCIIVYSLQRFTENSTKDLESNNNSQKINLLKVTASEGQNCASRFHIFFF